MLQDSNAAIQETLLTAGITARGHGVRVVLEQSPQRKHDYNQHARALEELRAETQIVGKWIEDGRALGIYAAQSWQDLGRPSPPGWTLELPPRAEEQKKRSGIEGAVNRAAPLRGDVRLPAERGLRRERPCGKGGQSSSRGVRPCEGGEHVERVLLGEPPCGKGGFSVSPVQGERRVTPEQGVSARGAANLTGTGASVRTVLWRGRHSWAF